MSAFIDKHLKVIFILPTILFVFLMIVFPLCYTAYLSFHSWNMGASDPQFLGLQNYIQLLGEERFLNAVGRTLSFSLIGIALETVLGVALATLLHRKFMGKNLVKTCCLLPYVATPVAVGMMWMLIYEPTIGIANKLLGLFGIPPQLFLASSEQVLGSLILVDVWEWTPMIMLIVLAGFTALPAEPYESAKVDGATAWQCYWKITIPLASPSILVAILLRLIDIVKTFDIIYATTQGGPNYGSENINVLAMVTGFNYYEFGKTSAIIVLFFLFVLVVSTLFLRIKRKLEVDF